MKKYVKILTLILTVMFLFFSTAFFVGCDEKKIEQMIIVKMYKENSPSVVATYEFSESNWSIEDTIEYDGYKITFRGFAKYSDGTYISETVAMSPISYSNEQGFPEERDEVCDKGYYLLQFRFFTCDFNAVIDLFII